ncbi:MAG: HNH endonuclease [Elainella sp.]
MSRYIPTALRRLVYDRADGCCEYCLTPEFAAFAAHEVDDIVAQKHGGLTQATTWPYPARFAISIKAAIWHQLIRKRE